jgi:hypothetical protein
MAYIAGIPSKMVEINKGNWLFAYSFAGRIGID